MSEGERLIEARFGTESGKIGESELLGRLEPMLARRACRRFLDTVPDERLVDAVVAAGLSAPTKSALQQADVVRVADPALRAAVLDGMPGRDWALTAPVLLVVCGNGRRLANAFEQEGRPFVNDHFDALFNAIVDASLVLGGIVSAAALVGLGACPLSRIRDRAAELDRILGLPERVFPVAGLCLGWPDETGSPTPRFGRAVTVHTDRYDPDAEVTGLAEFDARRGATGEDRWAAAKVRQFSELQRADFGAYLRGKGFSMT